MAEFRGEPAGATLTSGSRAYAVATILTAALFGFLVAALASISDRMRIDFDADWPRVPLSIIRVSPWAPLVLMLAVVALVIAVQRMKAGGAKRATQLAIMLGTALLGAFACLVLLLPIVQLMQAMPD